MNKNNSFIKKEKIHPEIVRVILNRPDKRNALNAQVIEELIGAFDDLAVDKSIRVILLAGEGEHFCAGADIEAMRAMANNSYEENVADAQQLALLLNTIYNFPKPTIALAHGSTLGGGLGLLASCDMALAEEGSHFCFSEVKIGLTPSVISPYIISAIGARAARYYFLTAEKFNGAEAKRLGLIHQVVPHDELLSTGVKLAESLLKNAPQALTEAKNLISTVTGLEISEEIMQFTSEHLAAMRSTAEAQTGLKAFLDKKEPKWK